MISSNRTICQVLHSLTIGGAEVLASRLARSLNGRFRFVFACLDELGPLGEELRREGHTVEVVGRRPGMDWACMRSLRRFWRREGVNLVHAHQYTPFFYSVAARGWRSGPPVFFTEHGRFVPDYPRRKRIWFNRLMLRRRDRVVGVGEAVRQALIRNEGIPDCRVGLIYNGIEIAAARERSSEAAAVRGGLGIGADAFMIVQVARLDYLKDHITAVRTIRQVAKKRPDATLVFVGDGPERPAIEREIRKQGVEERTRMVGFVGNPVPLLQAADAFLLTSISEGIPVTVIEAMAAGLPVVTTDVGGLREMVEEGRTGLFAGAGDDLGLAGALLQLADSGAMRERMGAAGLAAARARFSQQAMHRDYCRIYNEMLVGLP